MITKEQAIDPNNHEFHYAPVGTKVPTCNGKHSNTWRRNGTTKTWKSKGREHEFRIPVKFGLYQYGAITHLNAKDFHLASECPHKCLRSRLSHT